MHEVSRSFGACVILASLTGCSGTSDFQPGVGQTAEQIVTEACAKCHGNKGKGKFGFLLSIAGTDTPADEIVAKIKYGGHLMPAFPHISEQDAKAVAGFLKH